jgi:hypothetical protein
MFTDEKDLLDYWKSNGLIVEIKFSKTLKENAYYLKER